MTAVLIVVERQEAGKTLAAVLKQRLGWSWSRVKRLIQRRHVRIGQQIETNVARRVKKGQQIRIADGLVSPAAGLAQSQPPAASRSSRGNRGQPAASFLLPPRPAPSSINQKRVKRSRSSDTGPASAGNLSTSGSSRRHPDDASSATGVGQSSSPGDYASPAASDHHSTSRPDVPSFSSHLDYQPLASAGCANFVWTPSRSQRARSIKEADGSALPDAISIVHVDEALVVVNKPAGLTTLRHAYEEAEFGARARRYLPRTLADYLLELLGLSRTQLYPVHRLDRDTSGLVVFGRSAVAAQRLAQQLRQHRMARCYWAITRGIPAEGRLESWLIRDRGDGRRGSTPDPQTPGARHAITHVRVRETFGRYAWVECTLETGRTHQVRIHLGEAGTPLCGERIYDRPLHGPPLPDGSGAHRPMLHAVQLGLYHPLTNQWLQWDAPLPADFQQLLHQLRRQASSSIQPPSCDP
ncbi:MAG: pseudouridine synthase [Gemmataceae bacterium]|nr:pseudouridine synthase [Gemmataceae bacterium]